MHEMDRLISEIMEAASLPVGWRPRPPRLSQFNLGGGCRWPRFEPTSDGRFIPILTAADTPAGERVLHAVPSTVGQDRLDRDAVSSATAWLREETAKKRAEFELAWRTHWPQLAGLLGLPGYPGGPRDAAIIAASAFLRELADARRRPATIAHGANTILRTLCPVAPPNPCIIRRGCFSHTFTYPDRIGPWEIVTAALDACYWDPRRLIRTILRARSVPPSDREYFCALGISTKWSEWTTDFLNDPEVAMAALAHGKDRGLRVLLRVGMDPEMAEASAPLVELVLAELRRIASLCNRLAASSILIPPTLLARGQAASIFLCPPSTSSDVYHIFIASAVSSNDRLTTRLIQYPETAGSIIEELGSPDATMQFIRAARRWVYRVEKEVKNVRHRRTGQGSRAAQ